MSIPSASIDPPSSPSRPNAASSPIPATAGGRTSGSSTSVTTTSRSRDSRVAIQYAAGVPNTRIRTIEIAFVLAVTTSASFAASVPSAETSSPGGTRAKIATTGRTRKASATLVARTSVARKSMPLNVDAFGTGQEARVPERGLPPGGEDRSDPRLRGGLVRRPRDDGDLVPDARLRPCGDPDDRHLVAHGARIRDVDEPGVRLAERDLARHRPDVRLAADDLARGRSRAPSSGAR